MAAPPPFDVARRSSASSSARGLARERGHEQRFDALGRVQKRRFGHGHQRFALVQVRGVADQLAVHQRQRLQDRRLGLGARHALIGEAIAKLGGGAGQIRQRHAAPRRSALLAKAGGLHDAGKQLIGRHPPQRHAGEAATGRRRSPALVSGSSTDRPAHGRDRANQIVQVKVVQRELPGHLVQQLGMRRRIGLVQVVDRVHEAAAQEMVPQPIDGGAGKVRIVGLRDPAREQLALVGADCPVGRGAVEKRRLDR